MEENKNLNPEPIKAEETAAPDDKAAKKPRKRQRKPQKRLKGQRKRRLSRKSLKMKLYFAAADIP